MPTDRHEDTARPGVPVAARSRASWADMEHAVSVVEAAAILGVHRSTVHRWIARGALPARRWAAGRRWIVQRPDVERRARERAAARRGERCGPSAASGV